MPEDADAWVDRFLSGYVADIVDQLSEWVRIPSVAADPARSIEVARSASWLAGALRELGFSTTVYPTDDTSAVYAEWLVDPDAPTVLIYSHHDVRHAKPEEWEETDPSLPFCGTGACTVAARRTRRDR